MNRPILFAETPRAGRLGHRFLVAADNPLSEPLLSAFARAVNADDAPVWGANFLGVAHPAEQFVGPTVRIGREIMIVAGVDVERLSESSRARLSEKLKDFLNRLESEVLQVIDWTRLPSGELVVPAKPLTDWNNELLELRLPVADWQAGPRRSEKSLRPAVEKTAPSNPSASTSVPEKHSVETVSRLHRKLFLTTIGVCIVLLLLFSFTVADGPIKKLFQAGRNLLKHDRPITEPEIVPPEVVIDEQVIQSLAEEWGCRPEDVDREIIHAQAWDKRDQTTLSPAELHNMRNKCLISFINKHDRPISKSTADRPGDSVTIRFSLDKWIHEIEDENLKRLVESRGFMSADEVIRFRQDLYRAWTKWSDLRKEWDELGKETQGLIVASSASDSFIKMISDLAAIQPDKNMGIGFIEPKTPLFSRQDEMIVQHFQICRASLQGRGVYRLFSGAGFLIGDDLASFVDGLKSSLDTILENVRRERAAIADLARSQGLSGDKIFDVYRAFEEFLETFADFQKKPSDPASSPLHR